MTDLDRIDRSIDINATAESVWELISQPGWWINPGTIVNNQVVEPVDGAHVIKDPRYGSFTVRTETLEAPRHAAFRWLNDTGTGTHVEFWITDRASGVELRVVESGFSSLSDDRETWLAARAGNVEGWKTELAAAETHFDPYAVQRSIRVAASRSVVWDFVTTAHGLAQWFAFDGASIDLRQGGDIELNWKEHGRYLGTIDEVIDEQTLTFRYAHVPDATPDASNSTTVTFSLSDAPSAEGPAGCLLTVTERGLQDVDVANVGPDFRAQQVAGWDGGLEVLATLMSRPSVHS